MRMVKTILISAAAALLLSACGSGETYDKHSVGRDSNVSGVRNITPTDWTAFQKARHKYYGEHAERATGDGGSGEVAYFVQRTYTASYGGYQLPEELDEHVPPEDQYATLLAARNRLMEAFELRARILAPDASADAQANFDCWLYKVAHGASQESIDRCKAAYEAAMAKVEAALDKCANKIVVYDGSVVVNGKVMQKKGKAVRLDGIGDEECEVDENMEQAKVALPKAPKVFTLYYDTDEDLPTPDSSVDLNELADRIAKDILERQHHEVSISGHADRQASEAYNERLSQRRANNVRDALLERGVGADKINVDWFGETRPVVPTADGVPEPLNRRVEINVR